MPVDITFKGSFDQVQTQQAYMANLLNLYRMLWFPVNI